MFRKNLLTYFSHSLVFIGSVLDAAGDLVGNVAGYGFQRLFSNIIDALRQLLANLLLRSIRLMLNTPYPNNLNTLSPPSNGIWEGVFIQFYERLTFVIVPMIFMFSIGLVLFTNIIADEEQRIKYMKRLTLVFPLIFTWWWFGAWLLRLNQEITLILVDESVAMELISLDPVSLGVTSMLLAILLYVIGLFALGIVFIIYIARWVALVGYMAGMPLILTSWCIPVPQLSNSAGKAIRAFPGIVFSTVPVAIFLRFASRFVESTSGVIRVVALVAIFCVVAYLPLYTGALGAKVQRGVTTAYMAGKWAAVAASTGGAGSAAGAAAASSSSGKAANFARKFGRSKSRSFVNPTSRSQKIRRAAKVGKAAKKGGEFAGRGAAKVGRRTTSHVKNRQEQLRNKYSRSRKE